MEKIVIAGEGALSHDLFGPAMHAAFRSRAFSDAARHCAVHVNPVRDDIWARGAACLVIGETAGASSYR
ncbi:hypothetical protein [Streptomyces sp. NBC_00316]|uniref:hypothetical protein n=1 Tax=Streptomyces sp. NBC_00316 TaxID=2975710 RepID=UPI003FA7C187